MSTLFGGLDVTLLNVPPPVRVCVHMRAHTHSCAQLIGLETCYISRERMLGEETANRSSLWLRLGEMHKRKGT